MLFSEVTASGDSVVMIITAVIALIGTIFTGIMAYLMAKLNHEARLASAKADVVAAKVDIATTTSIKATEVLVGAHKDASSKLDTIAKSAKDTHTLVNNNMLVQLRLNAVVTKRLAEMTKDPVDIEAAKLAEQMQKDHEEAQRKVDEKEPADQSTKPEGEGQKDQAAEPKVVSEKDKGMVVTGESGGGKDDHFIKIKIEKPEK